MRHATTTTVEKTTALSPIFLTARHATVKHWRHPAQKSTLCEQPIMGETQPTGISRECVSLKRTADQGET